MIQCQSAGLRYPLWFPNAASLAPIPLCCRRPITPSAAPDSMSLRCCFVFLNMALILPALAETLRHPLPLDKQLQQHDLDFLATQARTRGDERRGALVFYKSAAACSRCHAVADIVAEKSVSSLGPDLARLGKVTDRHLVESLLYPSKTIREEHRTHTLLKVDGEVVSGLITAQSESAVTLRIASDLNNELVIARNDIEAMRPSALSMMPEGLIGSIGEQLDFLDLVKYLIVIAEGGPERALSLKPSDEDLAVRDDTDEIDHAGIIKKFGVKDFEAGRSIFHGYCFNCHGADGNTPSLPTARAFGTQKLRFGSDPYRMFMTLSKGNGLMAAMRHLTPKERYQVVHYIRESFMRPTNPGYFEVSKKYLDSLPAGTKDGTERVSIERDFGPALGSQLNRDFRSVLTIPLDTITISYDLHSMDQAGVWRGNKLDLSETQHAKDRGEGTVGPDGKMIAALAGWQWGHDGGFEFSKTNLPPRGPMPERWMKYRGHFLHGKDVILSYEIDRRSILEWPISVTDGIRHAMRIGPGRSLILAIGNRSAFKQIAGDIAGITWSEHYGRAVLNIPADSVTRNIQITRAATAQTNKLKEPSDVFDIETMTRGGATLWPRVLKTTGTLGLEQGAYTVDTVTLPKSTPWNTWFRTSGIDFLSDGRMVVSTYGGDIWIVSGVDEQLLQLRWKRFASGLYEPMGVKVVEDKIYVTCKDRIVRLHDSDGNQEADFYECFCADTDVSPNFHAFNFDLQTDHEGNFYYAKSGHGADTDLPGAVFKISPDGSKREIYSTGFRTPNGMGVFPDGQVTVSDNQGQWTPASKINLLRPGGYYGWVQTYSIPGMWEPGSGTINVDEVESPETYDPPLVWMPQEFDSSSGGQLFVDDARFGPLSGHLLHTSFGKGWLYYLMTQQIDRVSQAAIIKLPFNFRTGVMRANVNPVDGQVYTTGLQGWNGGGRVGLLDGGIQRLRYTGKPDRFVTSCKVEPDGLKITLNFQVNPKSLELPDAFTIQQWNYRRQASYGSKMYSPKTGEVGTEKLTIEEVKIEDDGRTIKLNTPQIVPVDQLHMTMNFKDSSGADFREEIYWTLNTVPEKH